MPDPKNNPAVDALHAAAEQAAPPPTQAKFTAQCQGFEFGVMDAGAMKFFIIKGMWPLGEAELAFPFEVTPRVIEAMQKSYDEASNDSGIVVPESKIVVPGQ